MNEEVAEIEKSPEDAPPTEAAAEADPPAESAPAPKPTKKKNKKKTSELMLLRAALTVSGMALLVGFFLPWVTIGSVADISGLELVVRDNLPPVQRYILGLAPLVAVALTVSGIVGFKGTTYVGLVGGALVLGYGLFTVAYIVFTMIDVGLWMVLGSAIIAFIGSLAALFYRRGRSSVPAPP